MFLTKKSLTKILLLTGAYFVIAVTCTVLSVVWNAKVLLVIGIISFILCIIMFLCGYYAEGDANLFNLGNKDFRQQLKPWNFINTYEVTRASNDLVINKPKLYILRLAVNAYDMVGNKEKCYETIEEMIAIAPESKKAVANLIKVSHLYGDGQTEQAEQLLQDTQKLRFNAVANMLYQFILQTDRAIATGDYKIAEACYIKALEQTFPKPDSLSKLLCHYSLGEIYEKTGDIDKAISHYQYCAENGGQTVIKRDACEKLKELTL